MADIHWYTILFIALTILLGGILGAGIQSAISAYRNRLTSISSRVDFLPKFEESGGSSKLNTQPVLTDGKTEYQYNSLHQAQIQLSNQSTEDFESFQFGITLSPDDVVVYLESQSPDRHHHLKQLTPVTLSEPTSQIDFILRPFNRGDSYSLRLLIKAAETREEPGEIQLTSPEAVRFVNLPTVVELVEETASRASISLGPFQFSFDR